MNLLQRGAASLKRINEILDTEPKVVSPDPAVREVESGLLEVRNLSFSYAPQDRKILNGLNFTVAEGETLGILGKTGAGKTTLVSLLPRILDPSREAVFLGGRDVQDYDLSALRKSFGIVPQDSFLFSATIRENIAFGCGGALDDKTLNGLAELTTIDRDLAVFPKGYETEIGERGVTLSGGQKQRIAIARALAADPRILVFDDALSAVDTETEEKILSRLLSFRKSKTNIIISHRISALSRCDRILVLGHGKVAQEGTHERLLREEGLYREIHALQSLGTKG